MEPLPDEFGVIPQSTFLNAKHRKYSFDVHQARRQTEKCQCTFESKQQFCCSAVLWVNMANGKQIAAKLGISEWCQFFHRCANHRAVLGDPVGDPLEQRWV